MTIKFSVVIPTYNASTFIEKALQSVFQQTYLPDEVIVIDDGSNDDIENTLLSYLDRIRFVKKENTGAADTRNVGVKLSKNNWVAFLDADDIWHCDKLKHQAAALTSNNSDNISLLCTAYKFVSEISQTKLDSITADSTTQILSNAQLINSPYLATPTVIINKMHFISIGGYNKHLHTAEDIDLYLRMMMLGSVIKLESELVHCLISQTSLTNKHDTYENEITLYKSFLNNDKYHHLQKEIFEHIFTCILNKLKFLLFKRRLTEFKQYLSLSSNRIPYLIKLKLKIKYYIILFLKI